MALASLHSSTDPKPIGRLFRDVIVLEFTAAVVLTNNIVDYNSKYWTWLIKYPRTRYISQDLATMRIIETMPWTITLYYRNLLKQSIPHTWWVSHYYMAFIEFHTFAQLFQGMYHWEVDYVLYINHTYTSMYARTVSMSFLKIREFISFNCHSLMDHFCLKLQKGWY